MAKVCVEGKAREGTDCTGDSCVDSRGKSADSRSVYQVQPETSPEVRLSRLGWQIARFEQNDLKVSFDICIRFMKCEQD